MGASIDIDSPAAAFDVDRVRAQFPALRGGEVFFDNPGGTQVPQRVVDAVADYLLHSNANSGGPFRTSERTDALLDDARAAFAAFLGAPSPREVAFGANMTTLTLGLSRALAQTWEAGEEIVVTRLDHDANVSPWVLAARDRGVTVRWVDVALEDCTLDLDSLQDALTEKTRLVAVGYASNAVGTIQPIRDICARAHAVGALCFVDAVQFAPHGPIDVVELDCDFLAASAYKFFGPHVGVLWGRYDLLAGLEPYRVRPASPRPPGAYETGTQNHEGIVGAAEAVRYLADLGGVPEEKPLRERLQAAWCQLVPYERSLCAKLLQALEGVPGVSVFGITERARLTERVPTIALTLEGLTPRGTSAALAREGIFVWDGDYYAVEIMRALGLAKDGGAVRVGLAHYNTEEEIERLAKALRQIVAN